MSDSASLLGRDGGGGRCDGRLSCLSSFLRGLSGRGKESIPRTVSLPSATSIGDFPPNVIRNQKYHAVTFLPVVLYEQFRFFFNMYFLAIALTQFVPVLQVGYKFTYIAPLVFVLSITIIKEGWDDLKRYQRDRELNAEVYEVIEAGTGARVRVPSSRIRVGDLVVVNANQRVPADMVLMRTTERSGASFIRTDQLDGETDWKLRRAVSVTQRLQDDAELASVGATLYAAAPIKQIYEFVGNYTSNATGNVEPLSLENTLWQNTVVASGTVVGCVVYTGKETRAQLNQSLPRTKVGLLDLEINRLSKVLFAIMVALSTLLIAFKGFTGYWYIYLFRFFILFSSIIPISMRVNLDLAKTLYSVWMMRDTKIPGTVVRSSTIPEELGRIAYLLSDKTGTLTRNEMEFRKLCVAGETLGDAEIEDVVRHVREAYGRDARNTRGSTIGDDLGLPDDGVGAFADDAAPSRHSAGFSVLVRDAVETLALCHNVSPTYVDGLREYQASSPDEVALVKYAERIGIELDGRDTNYIDILVPGKETKARGSISAEDGDARSSERHEILQIFPFTSESKRMGIITRGPRGVITFHMKGADTVMMGIVDAAGAEWLEEECDNMAREGLRTLVCAKRTMSPAEYEAFEASLADAKRSVDDRAAKVRRVVVSIEVGLRVVALTGVEDKLQVGVRETLEQLRQAGVKIWMLTGDKMETACCISRSSRLVGRAQSLFCIPGSDGVDLGELDSKLAEFAGMSESCLVVDGAALGAFLDTEHRKEAFVLTAARAPAVVCCRVSPTQKAQVVELIASHTGKVTAAIGDGGNDVSMIQAAHVGFGIVGKEGKQASLASDFSILEFRAVLRLILFHGRHSYKHSARLAQFVIHRGLVISFMQAIFSALYSFAAIALFSGWLLVGYSTAWTSLPVFCLILDEDISEKYVFAFPELYSSLRKGRALSLKTFAYWVLRSLYQAGVAMVMSIALFDDQFTHIVAISFTVLILVELLNIIVEVNRVHWLMWVSQGVTLVSYLVSMALLPTYFDMGFVLTWAFWWKTGAIAWTCMLPVVVVKTVKRRCFPPVYKKLG